MLHQVPSIIFALLERNINMIARRVTEKGGSLIVATTRVTITNSDADVFAFHKMRVESGIYRWMLVPTHVHNTTIKTCLNQVLYLRVRYQTRLQQQRSMTSTFRYCHYSPRHSCALSQAARAHFARVCRERVKGGSVLVCATAQRKAQRHWQSALA